ncbi:MAG TPA: YkgJ family cysteine cluster protein [Methylocystis sp.]|nr:YkgJ family cysteine cluster protein [Methylocystis sp.]
MTPEDENGAAAFFKAAAGAFADTIRARRNRPELIGALCAQSFEIFEKNVAIQAEGGPALACAGECAACCHLRVVVTAPEAFLVARFVAVNNAAFLEQGVDLPRRIAETAREVGSLSETQRLAAHRSCPFIEGDLCLAYRLRPLACRGHAAFDREACGEAVAGKDVEAAISTPHLVVRSLTQNAMMLSLRAAGLAWGLYELNRAIDIALSVPGALEKWVGGGDPLAEAAVADLDLSDTARAFDAIAAG